MSYGKITDLILNKPKNKPTEPLMNVAKVSAKSKENSKRKITIRGIITINLT
jgi:hypothetical protein